VGAGSLVVSAIAIAHGPNAVLGWIEPILALNVGAYLIYLGVTGGRTQVQ